MDHVDHILIVDDDREIRELVGNYLKKNGNSAADYLLSLKRDDGSIFYARDNDVTRVWVTADRTTALAGQHLPIGAPPRADNGNDANNGSGGTAPGDGSNTGGTSTGGTLPAGSLAGTGNTGSASAGSGSGANGGNGGIQGSGNGNGSGSGSGTNGGDGSSSATTLPPTDTVAPVIPEAPSAEVLAASEAGPQPSPLVATLVGLAVSGFLCGGTILLVRRLNW